MLLRRLDQIRAGLRMLAVGKPRAQGVNPAADPIARLEHDDRGAFQIEGACRREAREPRTEHDDPRPVQSAGGHHRSIHGGNMGPS